MRQLAVALVVLCGGSAGAEEAKFETRVKAAAERIVKGDLAAARAALEEALPLADTAQRRARLAWTRAILRAHSGDFDGAAAALLERLPETEQQPSLPGTFWIHNATMMIREADGDLAAALAECGEMTKAGAAWAGSKAKTQELVRLKELWHRAYLLRMLAERRAGAAKTALVRYAEAARRAYAELAPMPDYHDSVAVLDGYFAALDGRKADALAAARRVKVAENGDLEDLYLVYGAFQAGGDAKAAGEVRERIRSLRRASLPSAIMWTWIERDEAASSGGAPRFTPFHPTGRAGGRRPDAPAR